MWKTTRTGLPTPPLALHSLDVSPLVHRHCVMPVEEALVMAKASIGLRPCGLGPSERHLWALCRLIHLKASMQSIWVTRITISGLRQLPRWNNQLEKCQNSPSRISLISSRKRSFGVISWTKAEGSFSDSNIFAYPLFYLSFLSFFPLLYVVFALCVWFQFFLVLPSLGSAPKSCEVSHKTRKIKIRSEILMGVGGVERKKEREEEKNKPLIWTAPSRRLSHGLLSHLTGRISLLSHGC